MRNIPRNSTRLLLLQHYCCCCCAGAGRKFSQVGIGIPLMDSGPNKGRGCCTRCVQRYKRYPDKHYVTDMRRLVWITNNVWQLDVWLDSLKKCVTLTHLWMTRLGMTTMMVVIISEVTFPFNIQLRPINFDDKALTLYDRCCPLKGGWPAATLRIKYGTNNVGVHAPLSLCIRERNGVMRKIWCMSFV